MHKRWRNLQNARKFINADPIETDCQNAFTKIIHCLIKETEDKYYYSHPNTNNHLTNEVHQHICAFKLLSNDKVGARLNVEKRRKNFLHRQQNGWTLVIIVLK